MKKVAETIILLFKDQHDFSTAVAESLYPLPSPSYRKLEELFELPLDAYGIKNEKAHGNLIHFAGEDDDYKVTVLLLEKYEPPILGCVINEVLAHVVGDGLSNPPTLLVPLVGMQSLLKLENRNFGNGVALYSFDLGPQTDVSHTIATRTQKLQSSLQIHYEPIAWLLEFVRLLKLPTVILSGQKGQNLSDSGSGEQAEVIHAIVGLVASVTRLGFSRERLAMIPTKRTKVNKEPWRALYG